ncbi:unnamed protein product [Cyprideis torosa]|uniref:Uncharacterized protein n=1 Tax=Cyprideis torosa TaxID=163714 RepID=A0A7R8WDL8_9CRUS|nr:unnamed protein product [Cyprideis torosa]CAG0893317.1 unnamed protein product [Cyprideis torosa]
MRNVQAMSEVKTPLGCSRAFVRLALEKKVLSAHLRTVLSNHSLLRTEYKRYAFLRSDDEREQFLYHLLTLNAVDFFCFTNTFTKAVIPYSVLVVPASGTGTTTANVWFTITGTLAETNKPLYLLDKSTNHVLIHHVNLGILSTLRIGHDNSGPHPNWRVKHVIVRNEITGHTYKFPCGRWLGRNVDDGSIERLLVAELMSAGEGAAEVRGRSRTSSRPATTHSTSSSLSRIQRLPSPMRSPQGTRPTVSIGEIQEAVRDAVNSLTKYFHLPEPEMDCGLLTKLLCGDGGLVPALEQALLVGFKSTRIFSKNLYLWDYLTRCQYAIIAMVKQHREEGKGPMTMPRYRTSRSYCVLVDRINTVAQTLGKNDKFHLFICISLRDQLLPSFLSLLAEAPPTAQMFEEWSFLRRETLLRFVQVRLSQFLPLVSPGGDLDSRDLYPGGDLDSRDLYPGGDLDSRDLYPGGDLDSRDLYPGGDLDSRDLYPDFLTSRPYLIVFPCDSVRIIYASRGTQNTAPIE